MRRLGAPILVLIILTFASSCEIFDESDDEQYLILVDQAWSFFEFGDYQQAEIVFSDAIGTLPDRGEAYMGRGWSQLLLDQALDGMSDLSAAQERSVQSTDLLAGFCIVEYDLEYYIDAIASATTVLSIEPQYSFQYLPSIDHCDIRLIRASSHFALGENHFPQAVADVNELASSVGIPVSLNTEEPSSWIVSGEAFASIAAALARALELLAEQIR